jgi:hypothetical protein
MVESSSRNFTPESVLSTAFEIVFVGENGDSLPLCAPSKTISALIGFPLFQLRANPVQINATALEPN